MVATGVSSSFKLGAIVYPLRNVGSGRLVETELSLLYLYMVGWARKTSYSTCVLGWRECAAMVKRIWPWDTAAQEPRAGAECGALDYFGLAAARGGWKRSSICDLVSGDELIGFVGHADYLL